MVPAHIGLHTGRKAHRQPQLALRRRPGRRHDAPGDRLFVQYPLINTATDAIDNSPIAVHAGKDEGPPVVVFGKVASDKPDAREAEAERVEDDGVRRLVDPGGGSG